jgi:hypothetical protein
VSREHASRSGWSAVLLGAVAVACCLAAPALVGLLGGAVLWGVGLPVAIAIAVALAGACYALLAFVRRRDRNAP